MQQRVGTCSICGGDVVGYRGAWMSLNPPPADHCTSCGGVAHSDVIPMHPKPQRPIRDWTGAGTNSLGDLTGTGLPKLSC